MSPGAHARAIKAAALLILACLVLIYAGSLVYGFTMTLSSVLIRMLELIGSVALPIAGAMVLAWFAYKLMLEPLLRQRKLDRIRDHRARRALDSRE